MKRPAEEVVLDIVRELFLSCGHSAAEVRDRAADFHEVADAATIFEPARGMVAEALAEILEMVARGAEQVEASS